jgi:hypothetical protein
MQQHTPAQPRQQHVGLSPHAAALSVLPALARVAIAVLPAVNFGDYFLPIGKQKAARICSGS